MAGIAMPLLNGTAAPRQILHELPETKVLSLSAHSDGKGLGATFSLEIPLMASVAARVPA